MGCRNMAAPGGELRALHLVCAALATLSCILPALYPTVVAAQGDDGFLIDCYSFGGVVSPNNTKCPGSNACCNAEATCLSNRLCANKGDGPNLWVRGPCAVEDWDDSCPQICMFGESASLAVY